MTSTTEVIVLSSSPNTPTKTPPRCFNDNERLRDTSPRGTTPLPLPSTPGLPDLPSRSRFFAEPGVDDKGAKKKRQAVKKTAAVSSTNDESTSQKPRKRGKKVAKDSKTTTAEETVLGSLDSRDNAAKKPPGPEKGRKKTNAKSKESGNMKLAGKVTKANGDTEAKKSKAKKRPSTTAEEDEVQELNVPGKDEGLHLQEAIRRRLDWTPPRETAPGDVIAAKGEDDIQSCDGTMDGFGKLLSDYNFTRAAPESQTLLNGDGAGLTKRRRIELVNSHVQPQPNRSGSNGESSAQGEDSSSSTKQKKKSKVPKRPTTLTARMTAQYTLNEESGDVIEDLSQHIGKAKSRRGKAKTTENDSAFIVLSPEAAAKALDDQDLVFGTCSQLERDDSPQALQEIQQAIKESERLFLTGRDLDTMPGAGQAMALDSASTRPAARSKGTRNMWSVAARDTDGSLARTKSVDACDLPSIPKIPQNVDVNVHTSEAVLDDDWLGLDYGKPDSSRPKAPLSEKNPKSPVKVQSSSAAATSSAGDVQVKPASTVPVSQPSMPQFSGFTDAELSKQVASYGFKSVRGRKKMIDLLQKCWESKNGSSDKPLGTQSQPQAENARLVASSQPPAHEVPASSAGPCSKSKPKKQTKSTQKKTSTETTTHASTTSTVPRTKSPSKPARSRRIPSSSSFIDIEEIQDSQEETTPPPISTPQKNLNSRHIPSSSSFIDIDEIQDSEDELTPSPSRVQKRYTDIFSNVTSPAREHPLELMTKTVPQSPSKLKPGATKATHAKKTSAGASPSKQKQQSSKLPGISAQITKAVRDQSRPSPRLSTGSRSHPTWHEKILMYDPIILEDFTTWLNVEGLGLVGEDREVSTIDVREWCEGKGICCCWKNSATW